MGQVSHGNATTTHATRKEIQEASKEVSNYTLSNHFGINFQTVKKWRERDTVEDRRYSDKEEIFKQGFDRISCFRNLEGANDNKCL